MTLRQRLERLEGPKPPPVDPVDEAAIDAEIRELLREIAARDGISVDAVLAQVEAEMQALAGRP